jgi:tetratricopeptide (TPR) repeat protein
VIWAGDFSSPVPWLDEAMNIFRQLGDETGQADTLNIQGSLAYWLGNYQQARTYYEEAIVLYDKVGSHWMISWSHVNLAYAVLRQGNFTKARELLRSCIQRFQKTNTIIGLIYAVEGLANLNVNQEHFERAALLYAWADATREEIADHRPPLEQASVERDLAVIRSQLDDHDFTCLSTDGRTMTTEQAMALALEE